MAKTPVSEEELQLKKKARRRLVGAIVLVLLVVVFVPMFLDREQRPQKQDIDIRIPPIPGQTQPPQPPGAAAPTPPAAAVPPAPTPEKPAAAPTAPADASAGAPAAGDAGQSAPPTPAPTAAPEAKPAEPAKSAHAEAPEGYVIQVGAFSDPGNARHLLEKMKAEKVPAYSEPVKTPQGEKTRVRAGPYPTLAAAEKGRARLKALKLLSAGEAKIVRKGE